MRSLSWSFRQSVGLVLASLGLLMTTTAGAFAQTPPTAIASPPGAGTPYLWVLYADGLVKLVLPPAAPGQQALAVTTLHLRLPSGQPLAAIASVKDLAQGPLNVLWLLSTDGRVFSAQFPPVLPAGPVLATVFGCTQVQLPRGVANIAASPSATAVWALAPGWAWRLFGPAIGISFAGCPTGTTIDELEATSIGFMDAVACDRGGLSVFWVLAQETTTGTYRVFSLNAFQPRTLSPPCAQGCTLPAAISGAVSIAGHAFANRFWILQQDGTIRLVAADGQVLQSFLAP